MRKQPLGITLPPVRQRGPRAACASSGESVQRSHALSVLSCLTTPPCAGLRIQRMPSEAGVEFGAPEEYPWMTVASPSCHDTSTSRAWYEQLDVAARERFWTEVSTSGKHAGCRIRAQLTCAAACSHKVPGDFG